MTGKSSGFGSRMGKAEQPPLKTWAMKAAVRAVLREGDPEIADMLFAPLSPAVVGTHGQTVWRGERERTWKREGKA